MEESMKQRLMRFIKSQNLSQGKFERMCGMSNGYLCNIKQSIGSSKIQSIAMAFPQLNTEWLLTGTGDMLNEGYTTFDPVGVATPTAPNLENEIKILQIQLELKEQLIDSLQAEVNTLKDMNKQLLQAITKSIESNTQQKSV